MPVQRYAVFVGLVTVALAGPAGAVDCFPKIKFIPAPHAAPHPLAHRSAAAPPKPHIRHIHHFFGAKKAPRIVVASRPAATNLAESSLAQQTIPVYVPRPVSCDKLPPLALQSLAPARPIAPAQRLLDAIAGPGGPPDTVITPGGVGPSLPGDLPIGLVGTPSGGTPGGGTPGDVPGGGFPGGGTPGGFPAVLIPGGGTPGGGTPGGGTPGGGTPGGGTPGGGTPGGGTPGGGTPGGGTPGGGTPGGGTPGGGTPGGGTPGGGTPGGGTPGGGIPGGGGPPDEGSPPNGGSPIIPPDQGTPTIPGTPDTPPGGDTPGGPGTPPPGIPEPATWALMMLGFFGVGAALRGRKASPRHDAEVS